MLGRFINIAFFGLSLFINFKDWCKFKCEGCLSYHKQSIANI